MEKRTLGNTDLQIYPVVFGGNVFGWTIDEKQSFEMLNGFTERHVTVQTAGGHSGAMKASNPES